MTLQVGMTHTPPMQKLLLAPLQEVVVAGCVFSQEISEGSR